MFKRLVMLLREYSGGDGLHLHRSEPQEARASKSVSALRGSLGALFVKSNPFLAVIPGLVKKEYIKKERGEKNIIN